MTTDEVVFYTSPDRIELLAYNTKRKRVIHFFQPEERDLVITSFSRDVRWEWGIIDSDRWKGGKIYEGISLEEALLIPFNRK